jgi:hypothetical protein
VGVGVLVLDCGSFPPLPLSVPEGLLNIYKAVVRARRYASSCFKAAEVKHRTFMSAGM